jgi:hypothetical protein
MSLRIRRRNLAWYIYHAYKARRCVYTLTRTIDDFTRTIYTIFILKQCCQTQSTSGGAIFGVLLDVTGSIATSVLLLSQTLGYVRGQSIALLFLLLHATFAAQHSFLYVLFSYLMKQSHRLLVSYIGALEPTREITRWVALPSRTLETLLNLLPSIRRDFSVLFTCTFSCYTRIIPWRALSPPPTS